MRGSILSLAAGATFAAGALIAGAVAAQPADMEAFDAEQAARGRPSLAWSRPATGLAPGAPLPQTFGPAYGGGAASGYFGAGTVLLGPIIVSPGRHPHGLGQGFRPRQHAHPHGFAAPHGNWRRGYRQGHRQGYRTGLRQGRGQAAGPKGHASDARPWAPGGLYYGGSVHARTQAAQRNAAKLRRARRWSYY